MILQMKPFFGDEEKKALCDYMDSDPWITEFNKTTEFENLIKTFTKAKHCIVVNNGTVSLTLAALACNIKPGDEVIIPNYTMIATANSIKLLGATPVFVDVESNSLCLDYSKIEEKITKKTKMMIIVSANGRYSDTSFNVYKKLAVTYGLAIVEDSAQALGSFYPNGSHIGSLGDIGSFSFSMPKIISTGQGGALITNDDILANKLRKLKDFGRESGGNDYHSSIGYNFKFTDIQAVIGIEQMKKLEKRMKRKKEIFLKYQDNLKNNKNISIFSHNLSHTTPWFIDCRVNNRKNLIDYLASKKIQTRPMYPPINKQPCYGQTNNSFPISQSIGENGLWLPSFVQLTDDNIDTVCNRINSFYEEK
jgi:perosamine synthetase